MQFQVSLAAIDPVIHKKYKKLCDVKQRTLSLYFRNEHDGKTSSCKSTPKFPSKNIRIVVEGIGEFSQIRLCKNCSVDSKKNKDSSGDVENPFLSADEKDTYSSSDSYSSDDLRGSFTESFEYPSHGMQNKSTVYENEEKTNSASGTSLLFNTYLSTEKIKDTPESVRNGKEARETTEKNKERLKITEKNEEALKSTEKYEERVERTEKNKEGHKSTGKNEETRKSTEKNEETPKNAKKNEERQKNAEKNEERLRNTEKHGERLKRTEKNEEGHKNTEKNEEGHKSTEKNEQTPKRTGKNNEKLERTQKSEETFEGAEKNGDTLETTLYSQLQPPSSHGLKSSVKEVNDTKKLISKTGPRTILDEEIYNSYKSFLEIESWVVTEPYQLIVREIERISEDELRILSQDMETFDISSREFYKTKKTNDGDKMLVIDVQNMDVEKARQIIIDKLQKDCRTSMKIDDIFEDKVSVGCREHNISKMLSSLISKRLERDYQVLEKILKAIASDDLLFRCLTQEVKYNLGLSDSESEDDASFEDLREKILKLPHVFGVGASKGILQIHAVSDEKKQTEEINSLVKGNKYENAYTIVPFKSRPKFLRIEPGHRLKVEIGGTLGCFLLDNDNNMYALTAAHILQIQNDTVHGNSNLALGNFDMDLSGLPLIEGNMDFGLIEIKPELRNRVRTKLKDDNHTAHGKWMIMKKESDIDVMRPVYKYGSKTSLRFGMFLGDMKNEDGSKVYAIEDVDESDGKRFAEEGDSGSVVCQFDQNVKVGTAISLLTRCIDKNIGQTPKRVYYTIPLKYIVKELKSKAKKKGTEQKFRLAD